MPTTKSFPSVLYHYTSSHVLHSIIQKSSIWLSINHHLNDYNEGKIFINALLEKVGGKEKADNISNLIATLDCYMFCVSTEKDLLSQWRGYAVNGAGVAIGFKRRALVEAIDGHSVALFKDVTYTDEPGNVIQKHESLLQALKVSTGNPSVKFLQSIVKEKWLIKNTAFKEESEYRLLLTPSKDQNEIQLNKSKAIRRYRATDSDIREYLELSFDLPREQLISEIVLGPRNNSNIESIRRLLKINGYGDVNVAISAASYR